MGAVRAHGIMKQFRRYEYAPDGFREPQRITLEDIERYAARFGPYDDAGLAFFMRQIGVMEDVFIASVMEQINLKRRQHKDRQRSRG